MVDFKKGDWVRRTCGTSLSTAAGRHEAGFVGQIDEVKMESWGMSEIVFTNGHRGLANMYDPWKPKVGDRVRIKNPRGFRAGTQAGDAAVVKSVSGEFVDIELIHRTDGNIDQLAFLSDLEPITEDAPVVAEAQPALRIEAGKFYRTRDGRKVGPMFQDGSFWNAGSGANGTPGHFTSSGISAWCGELPRNPAREKYDLIAEWVDEQPAQPTATVANDNTAPATSKFKVGDRVRVSDCLPYRTNLIGATGTVSGSPLASGSTFPVHIDGRGEFFFSPEELSIMPSKNTAIVALIENGTAKPATRPKVHASRGEATAEAERLALAHPGQEFGVFVLADSKIADVVNVPTPVLRAA